MAHAGLVAIISILLAWRATGQEGEAHWNQFRGPNGQGAAAADAIPAHFSPKTNVLWRTVVPAGHSSPVIWNNRVFLSASDPAHPKELVTLAIDRKAGKLQWRQVVQSETPGKFHPLNNAAASTPAADDQHVYEWMETMSGFAAISHPNLLAIRAGAAGDARKSHVAWENQRGMPETCSPLYYRGRLYLLRDGGLLSCLQATTGAELFRERVRAAGQYIASPIAAEDKVIFGSVPGVVTVIQVDDKLKVLARNNFQEQIFATPAVAENKIYLRTVAHLYALGE